MIPAFAAKLGLSPKLTNIGAQKIDESLLETYGMTLTRFSIYNNLKKIQFFEKTFLLTNISIKVVPKMPFFSFNNIDVEFAKLKKLIWRTYIAAQALPTTSWVKLNNKSEFAKVAIDKNFEIFVVYNATLKAMLIHSFRAFQAYNDPILTTLQWDKVSTKVPIKYFDYINLFSFDLAIELPKNMGINEHTIKLINGKQPFYRPIYVLRPVKLETLKTYIKTCLKTGFI